MEDGQQVPSSQEWLHKGELERLNEFRFDKRKNDYLLGRWTAKKVVHAYLDKAIPLSEIEIRNAESGAPEVYHQNKLTTTSISISHSEGTSFCVAGEGGMKIGCDLEHIEHRKPVFVEDYFTENEKLQLENASTKNYDAFVNVIWSAKESALKTIKTGLSIDTRQMDVIYLQAPLVTKPGWKNLMVYDRTHSQIFKGLWRICNEYVMTIISSEKDIILTQI